MTLAITLRREDPTRAPGAFGLIMDENRTLFLIWPCLSCTKKGADSRRLGSSAVDRGAGASGTVSRGPGAAASPRGFRRNHQIRHAIVALPHGSGTNVMVNAVSYSPS